jgi:dTDP-4-dehydrorhamnose 3,5-epimerase
MIKDILITKLNIIKSDDGSVFHGIKSTDIGFEKFGETYFSFINEGAFKGWKKHTKMTMNLIVPIGEIRFNFIDLREDSQNFNERMEINLSVKNYVRLTVPPSIWFGFKGLADQNMLVNIASIPHDPKEVSEKNKMELEFN